MFSANWLSALDRRFQRTNRARPRRRRLDRRLRVAAELSPLEDRCLMSRSMLGTHPRVRIRCQEPMPGTSTPDPMGVAQRALLQGPDGGREKGTSLISTV
jgi:hypothetical protein